MKWLAKIVVAVAANAVALWAATSYIPGFTLTGGFSEFVRVALILTALNFVLKPILKLILGPVIVLTLGIGLIIVNSLILYILDFLSKNLTIETIPALVYSAILIGFVNFIFHLATK
jgi:putative membrane protein